MIEISHLLKDDLEQITSAEFVSWGKLKNRNVLITGATGLLGRALVMGLLYANRKMQLGMTVVALVRDIVRAETVFSQWLAEDLCFIESYVEDTFDIEYPIDYIIHAASQTSSKAFINQAVETVRTAVIGTDNMLKLAAKKQSEGFVYLSSMEVYGHPRKGLKITEDEVGAFDPLALRNSYPIAKKICENLCCGYVYEYGIPAKIIRLTQTFGPGVEYNDARVFAEFSRCVLEKKDIILKTKGETERSYLYISDAVTAILTVLLEGTPGAAYNAADERSYCSIATMAEQVAKLGGVQVHIDLQDRMKFGYPDVLYMDLDTSRLCALGWKPGGSGSITEMFQHMIKSMSKSE